MLGRSHRPVCGDVRSDAAQVSACRIRPNSATRVFVALLVATLVTAVIVMPSEAQTSETEDLKRQIEKLRAENDALKKEVAELRSALNNLLNPREPVAGQPPATDVSISGLASSGSPSAPVTMVVFADYQSQMSASYVVDTHPQVDQTYVRSGTVRYVFKNFPDLTAHPRAMKAHEAAACAGDQGRYWEMHDLLFADQSANAPDQFVAYAGDLELDTDLFRYCLSSGTHAATIHRDVEEGTRGGVTLTPVFVLGLTQPGVESIEVMEVVIGVQPFAAFEKAIEAVLEAAATNR